MLNENFNVGPSRQIQPCVFFRKNAAIPGLALKAMVPLEGLEPPLLSEADFESAASTIPPQGQFRKRSLVP